MRTIALLLVLGMPWGVAEFGVAEPEFTATEPVPMGTRNLEGHPWAERVL